MCGCIDEKGFRKINMTELNQKKYNCALEKEKSVMNNLSEDSVRVIKISKSALSEFIYEKLIDEQEMYLDVNSSDVANAFELSLESGEIIFCAYKAENAEGAFLGLPEEIDLKKLIKNIPDTASTMYSDSRYKEYTKEELIRLSKI